MNIYYTLIRVLIIPVFLGLAFMQTAAQTVEARIDTLLDQMPMQEKLLQLHQEGAFNTPNNARLGIPGFIMADGPHGVRDGMATSFPVGIGMASMWDIDLAQQIGVAMGKEFRGKGKHQALDHASISIAIRGTDEVRKQEVKILTSAHEPRRQLLKVSNRHRASRRSSIIMPTTVRMAGQQTISLRHGVYSTNRQGLPSVRRFNKAARCA